MDSHKYDMKHTNRGIFLLINNMKFDQMAYRKGSDVDAGMHERYCMH